MVVMGCFSGFFYFCLLGCKKRIALQNLAKKGRLVALTQLTFERQLKYLVNNFIGRIKVWDESLWKKNIKKMGGNYNKYL